MRTKKKVPKKAESRKIYRLKEKQKKRKGERDNRPLRHEAEQPLFHPLK